MTLATTHLPLAETQAFIDRVYAFLDATGWPQTRLAKSAGISTSALSQFMSHQYPGDTDRVKVKVEAILNREEEKSALTVDSKSFIDTTISRRVFDIARACHLFQEIGVCYSQAGLGKTESAREYASRNNDAILIEADPGYTAKVLFQELRDIVGGTSRLNLHSMFVDCCEKLKGSGRLLMIDEAEQLPYRALEMLRRLHDKTQIGILLLGMPKLLGNLRGIKSEYAQLYSRVGMAVKLQPLTSDDTSMIIQASLPASNGIHKVFHKEAAGNTRRLFKMISRAKHIAGVNKVDIDDEVVIAAAGLLKVECMS